jgi:RHS repeat-associated protein
VSQQEFDPWGRVRSGGISQTTLNYTGPRLDGTGLVYYHARYDDPALGRFISADSVVPGAGPLTAAPHDAPAQAAWAAGGGGPANPQDLNRYAYGLNNPVRNTDPTGHCIPYIGDCRPFWEEGVTYTGWEDFKQYSAGVVEGMGSLGAVAASLLIAETYQTAYQGAQNLIADPTGSAAYLREQLVDPVVRGGKFLANDPTGAAAALNNDPRGLGQVLGTAAGAASLSESALSGREINLGPNARIAPFGNRTSHPTGELPHYHRRVTAPNGKTLPGQGIGRHRPWDVKSTDTSFWDRF